MSSDVRAIFFDFDGVIMDSMTLKLESYLHALDRFQFDRAEVKRLVWQYMGQSRQRILRFIHEELAGGPITDNDYQEVLALFNKHDDDSRKLMEFIPGSLEFLKSVHERFYTAVITGTPEDFILRTTAHFDLDRYFDIVRGSPDKKVDIARQLLQANQLNPAEVLFIGDGLTDQEAADAHNIRFVGRGTEESSYNPETAWRVIEDLNELLPELG